MKINEKKFEKVLEGNEKCVSLHSQNKGNGAEWKRESFCESSLREWSKQSLKGKSTRVRKRTNLINSKKLDKSESRQKFFKQDKQITKKSLILAQDER